MSYVTWYDEIDIVSICLLFCFDDWALTLLVLTECRFLHLRKYNSYGDIMGIF